MPVSPERFTHGVGSGHCAETTHCYIVLLTMNILHVHGCICIVFFMCMDACITYVHVFYRYNIRHVHGCTVCARTCMHV